MRRLLLVTGLGAAIAVTLAAVPFGASGDNTRFVIGRQLHFTGPTTAAGTFSIAGAFSDSGTVTATFTAAPGADNTAVFNGEETQAGDKGTITVHFSVVSYPASDPRQFAIGQEIVTGATGAYAGLVGTKLKAKAEIDLIANADTEIADSGS
jgi:hypothetical protein